VDKRSTFIERVDWFVKLVWRERPNIINNPIILRELITQLRKKQSFFYLFLFVGAGILAFLGFWNSFLKNQYIYPRDYTRDFLMGLTMIEGIILLLIAPLLSATSFCLEKERETWDLLRTSPINLASILLGKFLSSILFIWIIMLSMIPVFSLIMPFGGVSPIEITTIFCVFTEGIIIATLIGLYSSVRWKKTIQAISVSYIFCFIYFLVIPVLPSFLTHDEEIWILLSPVSLAFPIILGGTFFMGMSPIKMLIIHLFFAVAVITTLVALCFSRLKPPMIFGFDQYLDRLDDFTAKLLAPLSRVMRSPLFLILFMLLIYGLWSIKQIFFNPSLGFVDHRDYHIDIIIIISIVVGLFFPFCCSVKYYLLWKEKPWDKIGSSPQSLRRYLFLQYKEPLKTFIIFFAAFMPLFLYLHFISPKIPIVYMGTFFIFAEGVLAIAVISMCCSLITKKLILVILLSITGCIFYFSIIPLSPLRLAIVLFTVQYEAWLSITTHLICSIILFVSAVLFCQWRVLRMAGQFEEESVIKWFKRTVLNKIPKIQRTARQIIIPFFPDNRNPLMIRELRESFLYNHKNLFRMLLFLCLGSSFFFCFIPMTFRSKHTSLLHCVNYILIWAVLFIPFFVAPFAASSFRKERDQSTWDLICTTTLSPLKILHGKILASISHSLVRYAVFFFPIAVTSWIAISYAGRDSDRLIETFYNSVIISMVFASFMLMFSILMSVIMDKTVGAYIASFFVGILIMASPIVLFALFGSPSEMMELASKISPPFLIGSLSWEHNTSWIASSYNTFLLSYSILTILCYSISLFLIKRYQYRD
jgi:ABC-2 type transport system permease protein